MFEVPSLNLGLSSPGSGALTPILGVPPKFGDSSPGLGGVHIQFWNFTLPFKSSSPPIWGFAHPILGVPPLIWGGHNRL